MTIKEAKKVLHHPYLPAVYVALSYVNLTDKELEALIYRHLRGHTQEDTAEEMKMSVNGIQNIEKVALEKCCRAWDKLLFIKAILNTAP